MSERKEAEEGTNRLDSTVKRHTATIVADEGMGKRGRGSLDVRERVPPPVTDRGGLGLKFLRRSSRG